MFSAELTLKPIPPFSFDLSTEIFSNGDNQIRVYDGGMFKQVIRANGKLILLTLESQGSVEEPKLAARLKSNVELEKADKSEAAKMVRRLFNLDLELAPFYAVAENDATLKRVTRKLWGLRTPTTQTVYEALVDSIIEQQISLKVATSMERRMIKQFGETIPVAGEVYFVYPAPQALAGASIEDLRMCGLSQRKAEYIKETSALVSEEKLDLEKFRSYENTQEIVSELDAVRGIGVWTAELTVLRSLQKWDAMPADDLGLKRIISRYYCGGKKITSDQAKKIAEPWGNWRGLAAFYFVVAELLNVEV
jgi:DNA-3-methyladenine glycosylase II